MLNRKYYTFYLTLLLTLFLNSCKKFLETKSDQTLGTPSTLTDLQAILDNSELYRGIVLSNTGSDEYYVTYSHWQTRAELDKFGYIWDPNLNNTRDWRTQYRSVFDANTVLYNLDKISDEGNIDRKNLIKASALVFRAQNFYHLAQLFAPQFDSASASRDLGIPLRLNADFNELSTRSTVEQTYQQIIRDIEEAISLFPSSPSVKPRPSKVSAYALLARTYLQIGNYVKAKENADASLQLSASLLDFNTLDSTATYPIPTYKNNPEILLFSQSEFSLNNQPSRAKIDSNLYNSYHPNDLRRSMFFLSNGNGTYRFKGNYTGAFELFTGIASDEVYLIRAECWARLGNLSNAMNDLNFLLVKRWRAGTFVPYSASTTQQALQLILQERKKELIYRAIRWSDLRRLNKDPNFAITIKRELNGVYYELPPNDLRYTLLVPIDVINMTGMPQNPR